MELFIERSAVTKKRIKAREEFSAVFDKAVSNCKSRIEGSIEDEAYDSVSQYVEVFQRQLEVEAQSLCEGLYTKYSLPKRAYRSKW